MKSIILYALPAGAVPKGEWREGYSAIQPYSRLKGFAADTIFVRAELVDCADLSDALSMARPKENEVVLNTIPHL